jgi:lipopolysaccharide/colanic/teichoic acid biosynthesis glycosyltransferase
MLIKRMFDFTCALVGLIVLSPVFALVAVLVKRDSRGPAFYRQERVGRNGVAFRILKFRTMRVHAEQGGQITIGNDARVTKIGRALRRFKADELPQLINVLRGEMSLVGPRPEVPRYVAHYPPAIRDEVLSVLPGLTDWASIGFRDESSLLGQAADPERFYVEEILPVKLEYYVRYVRERSFFTDLRIIFATLAVLAPGHDASHGIKGSHDKVYSGIGGGPR